MEELVLKKFKILLVTILSATILSGCIGCGIDLNNKQNVDDSIDSSKSVEPDKIIDDISKFKITDVVSVNCVKGYPVNDLGFALCEEQTVNLIGLGDKGNLHYALTILACSKDYSKNSDYFEYNFYNDSRNEWFDIEEDNNLEELQDGELLEIVKSNDSLWIEYGKASKNNKSASNVEGYIWLSDDKKHNNDNFKNSYNYQMLRVDFGVYDQNENNTKYNAMFDAVNKGEDIVLYGATIYNIFSKDNMIVTFDGEAAEKNYHVQIHVFGLNDNPEQLDVSSVLKPGDHIYFELGCDEEIPEVGEWECATDGIWGYIWLEDNVSNNYVDFMNSNYIGVCARNNLVKQENLYDDDKYYDKILRYFNGY